MADFVTLTCPSCGGKLQITNDIERFACGHCGSEHIVKRSGGIVALAPVVEGLAKVQTGVDKTAAELAIKRLQEEIKLLNDQRQQLVLERDSKIQQVNVPLLNKKNEYLSLETNMKGEFRRVISIAILFLFGCLFLLSLSVPSRDLSSSLLVMLVLFAMTVLVTGIFVLGAFIAKQRNVQSLTTLRGQVEQVERNVSAKVKAIQSEMQSKIDAIDKEIAKKQPELEDNRRLVSK